MDGKRKVKKLLEGKPGGGKKKGRLRLKWMDDVEVDVRNMAVKSGEQELWTEQNGHMS
jgi:hypothetical protein